MRPSPAARPAPPPAGRRLRWLALAIPLLAAGCAGLSPLSPELSLDDLRTPGPTAYFLGERFQGERVTGVVGTRERPTVVYGGCDQGDAPEAETCVPPVQLEQQPLDRQRPARYDGSAACTRGELRGVPVAWLTASYVDVFAGDRTVTVYADGRERALAAVAALRSLDGSIAEGDPLPAPTVDLTDELARCAPG